MDVTQSQPYLDHSVVLLAGDFDESHFFHCPLEDFNEAIWEVLQPALVKVSILIVC
jgi:hypothetical protein